MEEQKLKLEQEINIALKRVGKNHHSVQDLNAQLTVINNILEELRIAKVQEIRDHIINKPNDANLAASLRYLAAAQQLKSAKETWEALATDVTRLEAEKFQNKATYENFVGVDPSQIAISPQMKLMIQQDPEVVALQNKILNLEQEKMIAIQRVGKNHSSVRDLNAQLKAAKSKLSEIIALKEKEIREYQKKVAETAFQNAQKAEQQLRQRLKEAEAKLQDLQKKLNKSSAKPSEINSKDTYTIAHWRFDKKVTDTVASPANKIIDTINGLNGIPFGGPTYRSIDGLIGLDFDGMDDRIFVPDNPLFALTKSLTLEAVIRFDGTNSKGKSIDHSLGQRSLRRLESLAKASVYSLIVFRGDDRGGLDPYFLRIRSNGYLEFHVEDSSGKVAQVFSTQPLPTGRWLHVAGTLDDSTGEQKLFIDGKQVSSQITKVRPLAKLDHAMNPGVAIGNLQSTKWLDGFDGMIAG
ncbi:MAG: LamG domain-containing protein, partial [Planctomycetota bacterium]